MSAGINCRDDTSGLGRDQELAPEVAPELAPDCPPQPTFWFVAQTKPRQERLALLNLERQGYRVHLPLVPQGLTGSTGAAASVVCAAPQILFPGYIFFAPAHAEQSISPVRSTVGVSRVVRFGQQIATLSSQHLDEVLAFVEQCTGLPGGLAARINGVAEGKLVEVVDGPFADYRGLVSRVGSERVMVLIDILGKAQSLRFGHDQLRVV